MLAYLSENADNRIFEALEREGFHTISLAPFSALSEPVSTHADMLLLSFGEIIFRHKDYKSERIKNALEIDEPMGAKYPHDVLLNIAIVGKNAFCNTKHASSTVLEHLQARGIAVHHVSQGYAHCSTCIVSDNAIITSDPSIADVAIKADIETLKISEGHISLPPYSYGFIGGASGVTENAVYFCGSLKYHPDGEKIRVFCQKHGKRIVELIDVPLSDVGGILFK